MRRFPAPVLAPAITALIASLLLPPAAATPVASTNVGTPPVVAAEPDPDDPTTWQTSDQVQGRIAAPQPGYFGRRTTRMRWFRWLAPGVSVQSWNEWSGRGPVRYYLIRMKWNRAGLALDYQGPARVNRPVALTTMLRGQSHVAAGINGDFFDIGDTGAPFGLGKIRRMARHRHGINAGWNSAFSLSPRTAPRIGILHMKSWVRGYPGITITNQNSPQVKPGGIGVYDWRWGRTSGFRWTDGQKRGVRLVRIQNGRVTENRTHSFPWGTWIRGRYLIARGWKAQRKLAQLIKGTRVQFATQLEENPRVAITGNRILLANRRVQTWDDTEMHPRTAIGIDRDHKQFMLFVVDGRQAHSRGYTMRELALRMKWMGAESALNLDGGGSTTMVIRKLDGSLGVINRPSGGVQRRVPNGLKVVSRAVG